MDSSSEGDLLGLKLVVLVVLLVLSAFFSGSEAAFLAASRSRVRQLREQGVTGAQLFWILYRNRALVLTTLLLGITLSNYTAERIATVLSVQWLGLQLGPVVAVVVMTIVIIVFSEVVPIQAGAFARERWARPASFVIAPLLVLLWPVVMALSFISRLLLYAVGVRTGRLLPGVSEEHLKAMIEQSEEEGVLEAGECRMMQGALDFGDQVAAQIMTPRPDMICVEAHQTLEEALRLGLEESHSRLPVYDETPDNIIGVLHLKDALPYLVKGELNQEVRVMSRSVMHVPESLPANEVLAQLQRRRAMLAVVKDEYGGTAGLVTVEDLLEEIVGQICDEYDVEEPEVLVVGETEVLCDARVALHEIENFLPVELPTEEYDSLGGLVMDVAGRIPAAGEVILWDGLELTVEEVRGPRLERIRVRLAPVEAEGESND